MTRDVPAGARVAGNPGIMINRPVTTDMTLEGDWFPSTVPPTVAIGERSWVYSSFAFLHYAGRRDMRIGDDTGIYTASMFDLGPDAEVSIGNYVSITSAVISTNARVSIGDYSLNCVPGCYCGIPYTVPWSSRGPRSSGDDYPDEDVVIEENV